MEALLRLLLCRSATPTWGCCRDNHEEEAIVICRLGVAVVTTTRRRRSWSTTSSRPMRDYVGPPLQLIFRCTAHLVVTIHVLLLANIIGWHGRSSANVAYPYPYIWGGLGEILPRARIMPKGMVCLEFPIQQASWVPTIVTSKSLTVWSQKMDHWKVERVLNWYSKLPEFQLSRDLKVSFNSADVLSRNRF
jgi:hypothetical protein